MPVALTRESEYSTTLTFPTLAAAEAEAARWDRYAAREDYETLRAYVAALFDLPERAVTVTPDPNPEITGAELRIWRDRLGLSGDLLAEIIGIAPRTLRRWEYGQSPVPSGVAQEMLAIEAETTAMVAEMIDGLTRDADGVAWVYTYPTDEALLTADPEVEWSAGWHRACAGRVADQVDYLVDDLSFAPAAVTQQFPTEAEYANIVVGCALATLLFLGGWQSPIGTVPLEWGWWGTLLGTGFFFAKMYFLIFCVVWIRWTFPRTQFYNLLKKCRRLDARHRKDKKDPDPLIAQLLSDADGVIMALPKDAPTMLRFCRPEHSPTAGVFMEAIKRSPSGMELIARLEGEKAELEARLNAAEEAIRASEARVLGAMKSHGELPEGKINSAAKSRIAKYLREGE